jgi:flagellar protein FliO/FliZ
MIRALTIVLSAAARTALAGAPALASHPFAAPGNTAAAPPSTLGGLGEMTLALGVVLAAIFGLAWVARRVRGSGGRAAEALDVLAEVRLGPKERAVLIKVGSAQLLVGVAPGRVNTLHVLAEPIAPGTAPAPVGPTPPSFRALLLKSLGKS